MTHFPPLIEAHQIHHQFGKTSVLNNISLRIHPKEIVTLIGPNGAGKSTLLKILLGLTSPTQGYVSQKKGLTVGFMPQKIQIDATLPMSVERFLLLGLPKPAHQTTAMAQCLVQLKSIFTIPSPNLTILHKVTKELNIQALLHQAVQSVSGGEMQRILLARALIREPDLLVLDEPVQGVDIQGQAELYQYINQIRNNWGCGILMVSHDLHIVMQHTDQVLCLNQHICCSGHPQSVSESPEYQALFGEQPAGIAFYEHHHDKNTCEHTHGHTLSHHSNSPADPIKKAQ